VDLLGQLRGRLGHAVPGLRLLAEGLTGADAPIDFVALEPGGRVVLILVGDGGQDLELLGRGLAQRAWVATRLSDWIQLAPNLGLRPDSEVRVLLLCPSYTAETRLAVQAIGPAEASATAPQPVPRAAPAAAPPFRTGLTDADLGLTPEERQEFE
jgi:hypothetical protein